LLYKMWRFCLGLRKSAELTPPIASLIASGQIISSEPNMISGSTEREARTMQLQALPIRANLLLNSLRCFYAGLGLFAASALIAVGGSVASYYGRKLFFELTAVLASRSHRHLRCAGVVPWLHLDGSRGPCRA